MKWHHALNEKEGQHAPQEPAAREPSPATPDVQTHTRAHAHTGADARTHRYRQADTHAQCAHSQASRNHSAIARVAICQGSHYLIFRLICQVYSLANLNTNVDANEDSLFLHRLCVGA